MIFISLWVVLNFGVRNQLARASFRYLYRRRRNFGRIKNQRSQRATRCCKRGANVLTPEAVEVVREAYWILIIWFISHESRFAHIRPKAIAVRLAKLVIREVRDGARARKM
jgi:hypothetical protein